uniref:helix-hairpin-helix domain-containing protein n=1 Tax=Brachybacterium sp. GPGPB12 TaxID=3023517 RepID=UPI004049488D
MGEDGQTPVPAFSAATAERLWTAFEGSGEYAFNKSHTTAYGVLSYQTAYLKANHPAEFGAAVLRFTGSGKDKAHLRIATIRSLRAEGIEVKAPDINASDEFTVARDGKVWIGLSEIKDVGKIAATIVQERTRNGSFTSMADLAQRVAVVTIDADGEEKRRGVTSAQLTALAQAGAFDGFGDGFRMGHVIAARAIRKDPDLRIPQMEYSILEKATRQRATILAVTGTHPTKRLSRQIASLYRRRSGDDAAPKPPLGLHKLPGTNGARVHTGGIVSAFTERMTRRGSWMVTMELENSFTSIQMVGFSDVHAELKEIGMPTIGDLVEIRGSVRSREVEREVIDEVTGESSTQTIVEHSIILSGVEYMDVEDPDRDAEGDPELRVGALLADSTTHIVADDQDREIQKASAVAVLERDDDEEEFDPMPVAAPERTPTPAPERTAPRSATTAKSVSTRTPAAMVRRPRPAGTGGEDETRSDFDAELSAVATTAEWERLFQSLQVTTGHEFFLARPRRNLATGHDVGTFLRVETTDGTALVPVTAQRSAQRSRPGRTPAGRDLHPEDASGRHRHAGVEERLLLMNDAVNSGLIDPSTSVVDGAEPSVPRAG